MPSLNPIKIDDTHWQNRNVFIDDAQEVRIHYIGCPPHPGKETLRPENTNTILLICGFPNISYQWRYAITPLVIAGYRMVAHDDRGAG